MTLGGATQVVGILVAGPVFYGAFATWRAYTRSKAQELRTQARKVWVVASRVGQSNACDITAYAHNGSDAPIYSVWLKVHGAAIAEGAFPDVQFAQFLAPGEEIRLQSKVTLRDGPVTPAELPQANVVFRDSDGYNWQRWEDGRLMPPIDARPRRGWRRTLWTVVGKLGGQGLLVRWIQREGRPPLRGL
jgi:hypothetical protein